MKFLRIEKSLTSAENVVLTIVNRREGATLLNCDECHSIEVCALDLMQPGESYFVEDVECFAPAEFHLTTHQGL